MTVTVVQLIDAFAICIHFCDRKNNGLCEPVTFWFNFSQNNNYKSNQSNDVYYCLYLFNFYSNYF